MSGSQKPGKFARKMAAQLLDLKWVSRHRGDRRDYLKRHRAQVKRMLRLGAAGIATIAPELLHRISDEKTLRNAWDYLSEHGGQAPGPDKLCYDDVPDFLIWQACRDLRDEIRAGEYEVGDEQLHWISKGGGRGQRPLLLQDILDRVVQRACVEILQPLLDPLFDDRSFGYRPGRSPQHALALVSRLARSEGRCVWVAADIKDAFGCVPLPRLLDVIKKYLPDDKLAAFLQLILSGAKMPGLRQGGPLSPLLLNLYLDYLLDRKWRTLHADIPLIRYADDLLLLCKSAEEAHKVYADLKALLLPTGMLLKEDEQEAVRRLDLGKCAHYLGFRIQAAPEGLRFGLTGEAWDGLADSFRLAQEKANAPIRAVMALAGWIDQKGPCYPTVDHVRAYQRLDSLARKAGFDEIPSSEKVRGLWQSAFARWCRLQRKSKPRRRCRKGTA